MGKFKSADCCLNCKYRDSRIDKNILCKKYQRKGDHNISWMPDRGWCEYYSKTGNKNILRAEVELIKRMSVYEENNKEVRSNV